MPKRWCGKSRTCPLLAATSKSGPKDLLMVLALAGESTMTRFFFFRAAQAIICILTFVMAGDSFAGGYFFAVLSRWVTGRSRIHEAATVYGKRITDRELYELRRQRRLANQFMLQAVFMAQETIFSE